MQSTSPCDFGSITGINVEETTDDSGQRFGFYLVNPGEPLITASLAIVVDDVSLLYVAHSGIIEVVHKYSRIPMAAQFVHVV